jgi:DNA-binding NtrC family response regulator
MTGAFMTSSSQPQKRIVLVMARRDPALEGIERELDVLGTASWRVGSLQEFQQLTQQIDAPHAVITGVSLPDGNWCDVLRSVWGDVSTRVLVCTRQADERLWSEAIWRGVYDVLVEPFTVEYLQRCIEQDPRTGRRDASDDDDPTRGRDAESRRGTYRPNSLVAIGAVA